MKVTVTEAARHFNVDPATVRRWLQRDCPCVRKGRRGPGGGALVNLDEVAAWRGEVTGPQGPSIDEILQRLAIALHDTLEHDRADIRAGVSKDDAAAILLVAWERCCTTFGKSFLFDAQPDPIRALMRIL